MLNKNHSISVRLSSEDYDFLMAIDQNGAVTQSEKVRELITMAKASSQPKSFLQSYIQSQSAMAEVKGRYIEATNERVTSVEIILDCLAEAMAHIETTAMNAQVGNQLETKLMPLIVKCALEVSQLPPSDDSIKAQLKKQIINLVNKE